MTIQGYDPHKCYHFLRNGGRFCGAVSVVVFDAGPDGMGACMKHVGQVLLMAMGRVYGGSGIQFPTMAIPGDQWDAYERAQEASRTETITGGNNGPVR